MVFHKLVVGILIAIKHVDIDFAVDASNSSIWA